MDKKELNNKQELAVEFAVKGMTDGEIARKVGVSRQIVNGWRNHDADFMYALAIRRQALREKHQDSLNGLVEKAIAIVKNALDQGDPKTQLQAAMYVLNISGLKGYLQTGKQPSRREMEKELVENTLFEVVREMGWNE